MIIRTILATMIGLSALGIQPASGDEPKPAQNGDIVCGPRCLQYLLQCYGKKDPGLIELVREVQWPDIEAGSTLKALDEALRKRGVFTRALEIGPDSRLSWPYPVLLHLNGEDEDEGHFVVWLPSSSESREQVWTGLVGVRSGPPAKMAKRRSGAVLLTAPVPIEELGSAVSYHRDWLWHRYAWAVAGVLFTSVAFWGGGRYRQGRRLIPPG